MAQRARRRVQGEQVRQRGRAGSRQTGDYHRRGDRLRVDLRVEPVPVLDAQALGEVARELQSPGVEVHLAELRFTIQRIDERFEAVAERRVAEVAQTRFGAGGVGQLIDIEAHRVRHGPRRIWQPP